MQQKPLFLTIITCLLGTILVSWYAYYLYPDVFNHLYEGIPGGLHHGPGKSLKAQYLGGDHIQVLYLSWKFKQAAITGWAGALVDGYNFTNVAQPFYDFHIGVQFQLIALMMALTGSLSAGYSLTVVPLAAALTFLSGYALASQLTKIQVIRILSGLYFVLIPYRIIQSMGGHSGGTVLFLHCLYWAAVLKGKKDTDSYLGPVLAGLLLFLLTISDEHQGYYAILFSGIVFPIWFLQSIRKDQLVNDAKVFLIKWSPLLAGLFLSVGFGLIIDMMALAPQPGVSPKRDISEVHHYSVGIGSFFNAKNNHNIASTLAILAVLSTLGILFSRQTSFKKILETKTFPFLLCLLISTILMGGIISIRNPFAGVYPFFMDYVPYFAYQRVPTKMFSSTAIFMLIFLIAIHSWIAKILKDKGKKGASWLSVAILCLALSGQIFQLHRIIKNAGYPIIDPIYTAVPLEDRQLIMDMAEKEDPILFVPIYGRMDRYASKQQLLAMLTERRYSGGYNGNAPPSYQKTISDLQALNQDIDLTEEVINQAKARGFKTLVFDLNGPKDIYDRNISRPGRFDKYLSSPRCGKTLCVMDIL